MNCKHFFSNNKKGVGHWTNDKINSFKAKPKQKILDVACGNRKINGAHGIDKDKKSQADYIFDLEKPWKIKSKQYDIVFCLNFLEHTFAFDHVLKEIHRVLKPGGICHIEVPYYNSYNFGQLPFHHINFAENTIETFYTKEGQFTRYGSVNFKVLEKELYFTKPAMLIPKDMRIKFSHYIGNLCYQIYWMVKKE